MQNTIDVSFERRELSLLRVAINSYLINDFGCQCVEIQEEAYSERQEMLELARKIDSAMEEYYYER